MVILLVIVVLLMSRSQRASVPTFKFLSGRGSYIQIDKLETKVRETRFVYSFQGDYNSIVADANSELYPLGYSGNSAFPVNPPYGFVYSLRGQKPMDRISVLIRKDQKMHVFSTPRNSDYTIPTQYNYALKDGWVSVEITQRKEISWFTYGCLYLLNKLHRTYE